MTGIYAKGLHRPDPSKLSRRLHARGLLDYAANLPPSASLVPAPRLAQRNGTCHAHSAAGAIWCALNASGKQLPWVPSPKLIASCTYADVQGPADGRGGLQDTGADLSDDATALATWGIGPMSEADLAQGTDEPALAEGDAYPEPSTSELVIAGSNLIAGEYAIPVDAHASYACALAITQGYPIWVGFEVDEAFEQLGPNDVAQAPVAGKGLGGHAVYLSAFRTAADGTREWRLENSWGTGWADGGAVWCSDAWLMATWMLWPMAVKVVSP